MDRNFVHFSFNVYSGTPDLDEVIINRNIEKVKKLVNEKFIEQGGGSNFDEIIFPEWEIITLANIVGIYRSSYSSCFIHINEIKFIRK